MSLVWMKRTRILVLTLFFCTLLFLSISTPGMFVSPDENANAVFSQTWARTGGLFLEESLNGSLNGLLHPRSIIPRGSWLVPGSFLGLPVLAGSVAAVLGSWSIVLLTPTLALLAVLALHSLLKKFSSQTVADAASFFLLFHPAFWYYASRSMMHNVPFLSLLICSLWFVSVAGSFEKKKGIAWFVSGALLGLALSVRLSESIWVLPSLLIGFFLYRQQLSLRLFLFWIGGCCLSLFPFLLWNQLLYGAFWSTGYTALPSLAASSVSEAVSSSSVYTSLFSLFFPFGIHVLRAGKRVLDYGILLYPWTAIFPLLGWLGSSVIFWRQRAMRAFSRPLFFLFIFSFVLSAYLACLYGSWMITDNPNPEAVTIGNSYVRYWLPIFLLGSVWAGIAFAWIQQRFSAYRWFLPGVLIASCLYVGASSLVVFGGEDGLWATHVHLQMFAQKKDFVLEHTEPNAIVIVDRADKFLFPDRRVVVPLRSPQTYAALPELARAAPLYYFGITLPPEDVEYFTQNILDPLSLSFILVGTVGDESLYHIFSP